jgi:hypothetical protein
MLCRSVFAGVLAVALASRASACDRAVSAAVVVPQTAVVSPFVVLPQVVVPAFVAAPQQQRIKVIQPRRARTILRMRTVIR